MKHIQPRYLWTRDRLALGHIKLDTAASKDHCSDILTNTMSKTDIQRLP